jgi:ketosteroid isomerase-like protein
MDADDFDSAVTAYRDAQVSLLHGDAAAVLALWSTRDDISIANPFGPPQCGQENVIAAIQKGAAQYHSGLRRFEEIGRFSTADLGYVVQVEHTSARAAASGSDVAFSLRATIVFRCEDGVWKAVHRHADAAVAGATVEALGASSPATASTGSVQHRA